MIREAAANFQRCLVERGVPLRVLPGADVRIEPDLVQKIRQGDVVTLGDRRRHILLELPHDVYVPLDRLLEQLASSGVVGILSHPERNRGILKQPEIVRSLAERGCLLQITAGSLVGDFGSSIQQLSEWLVERRFVHFVSTDAHNLASRPPRLRKAFDRLSELAGREWALAVCRDNPLCVAKGESVSAELPTMKKSSWFSWFAHSSSSGKSRAVKVA